MKKNPKVSLKVKSKKILEISLVVSLVLHVVLFFAFKRFETEAMNIEKVDTILEVQDIPETEQSKKPPPPAAPTVPIESEDEELLEDITIDDMDISFSDFDDAPPPPRMIIDIDEIPEFLPIEDQPKIIGGEKELYKHIKYPEIALRADIEGLVRIRVLIDKNGLPKDFEVITSLHRSCDQAAIDAIKKLKFIPAKQRDKPVPFKLIMQIRFKIR